MISSLGFQTLDLDFNDKETVNRILKKISLMPCCKELWIRYSASMNGYHVLIRCSKPDCDLCRLVFDSPIRYGADLKRPLHRRNVLWDRKSYYKAGNCITLEAGAWRRVK